jgi:LytS/YehU family sensor histidine kinase
MNVSKNVKDISIPPLFMLPLVENAFKHGVSNDEANCWIHIDILKKNNSLIFKIENSVIEKPQTNGFGNGLGLRNLEQRLDILFPNHYDLKIMKDESSYLVTMRLDYDEKTEGGIELDNKKLEQNAAETNIKPWGLALKSMILFLKF